MTRAYCTDYGVSYAGKSCSGDNDKSCTNIPKGKKEVFPAYKNSSCIHTHTGPEPNGTEKIYACSEDNTSEACTSDSDCEGVDTSGNSVSGACIKYPKMTGRKNSCSSSNSDCWETGGQYFGEFLLGKTLWRQWGGELKSRPECAYTGNEGFKIPTRENFKYPGNETFKDFFQNFQQNVKKCPKFIISKCDDRDMLETVFTWTKFLQERVLVYT